MEVVAAVRHPWCRDLHVSLFVMKKNLSLEIK
jgi:hypothetical protein